MKLTELVIDGGRSDMVEFGGIGFRSFIGAPISQSLERLVVRNNTAQFDADLAAVILACPNLRIVSPLPWRDQDIANFCWSYPSSSLKHLSEIHLTGCSELTIAGPLLLATYLPTLKVIDLTACKPHFADADVYSLRYRFRHIEFRFIFDIRPY